MPVAVLAALPRTGLASEEEEPVSDRPHPIGDPPDDYPVDEPPDDDDDGGGDDDDDDDQRDTGGRLSRAGPPPADSGPTPRRGDDDARPEGMDTEGEDP